MLTAECKLFTFRSLAKEFVKKSLELDRLGEQWGATVAYRVLASIALQTNDFSKASSNLSQSIQIATETGARPNLAIALYYNAQLFMKQEDPPQACEYKSLGLQT